MEARVELGCSGDWTRTSCTHEQTSVGAANALTNWASQTDFEVHIWLLSNSLQFNPQKSEVIQLSAGRGRRRVNLEIILISEVDIQPSPAVKSLDVTLGWQLTFDQHVANVCKASYFHMPAWRHVRQSFPDDVARTVAVGSRLDFCKSLFTGISALNSILVQNTTAGVARHRSNRTIFRRRSLNYTSYQSGSVFYLNSRLMRSTLSKKISHPTCVIFCAPSCCLCSSTQDLLRVDCSKICYRLIHVQTVTCTWLSPRQRIAPCYKRCVITYIYLLT